MNHHQLQGKNILIKIINNTHSYVNWNRYGSRIVTSEYPTTGISNENAVASKINLMYQSDVEILSLKSFDEHVRIRYGGLIMAKSVKVS